MYIYMNHTVFKSFVMYHHMRAPAMSTATKLTDRAMTFYNDKGIHRQTPTVMNFSSIRDAEDRTMDAR